MKLVNRFPLLVLLLAAPVYAQGPPPDPPAPRVLDVPTVVSQLQAAGCQSERQIAAQTIVQQQKQIDDLKKQLEAKGKK